MIKRILIVDNGVHDFQYATVDVDDNQCKDISKYHCIEGAIHSSSLAKMVGELFEDNKCDEIHIDAIGTGLGIIDCIDKKYYDKIMICSCDARSNHEAICDLMSDIRQRKLFICKDSIVLYDILEQIDKEKTLYFNDMGICRLGKDLGFIVRRQLQLILGMYMCSRRQLGLGDHYYFRDKLLKRIK